MCRQYGQDSETAMEKEEILLKKRIQDLARTAYQRDYVTFSDFLDLNEQNIVHSLKPEELGASVRFFGGYEGAERQIAAFLPDALLFEWQYPWKCLKVLPAAPKFAETLTHRDYLGSILGLGIERCKIGDILVKGNEACFFCQERMADFLLQELRTVRHTSVTVEACDFQEQGFRPEEEEITGTVASVRLDSVISLAFSISRSSTAPLIEGGKVFVNGKLITSNGYHLNEGDLISVRGQGKFRYGSMMNQTKKGRKLINLFRYI